MDQQLETYFLEFKAVKLEKRTRKQSNKLSYSRQLLVQLILISSHNTIVESAWVSTEAVQNNINCHNATIRFPLSISKSQPQQWTLTLVGKQRQTASSQQTRLDKGGIGIKEKKTIKKLGEGQLNPTIYAQIYNECGKYKFQEQMQISNAFSLDYEVYISTTPEGLDDLILKQQHKREVKIIDNAFKKLPGNPKIRYVQFKQNREKSIRSEEFLQNQHRKIQSLKKSGTKYIPIHKDCLPSKFSQCKKYKQVRRPQQSKASLNPSLDATRNKVHLENRGSQSRKSQLGWEERAQAGRKGVTLNCFYMLLLLVATVAAGFMMFPSKKT